MGSEGKTGSAWTLIFLGDVALLHYDAEWARSLFELQCQSEGEIFRKTVNIPFNGFIQSTGCDRIEPGQNFIQDNPLTADLMNMAFQWFTFHGTEG
jgi:hypothetical protein